VILLTLSVPPLNYVTCQFFFYQLKGLKARYGIFVTEKIFTLLFQNFFNQLHLYSFVMNAWLFFL